MSTPTMDFVVMSCADANWMGYGRGFELVCEFLNYQHRMEDSNQELIDFLDWKAGYVDLGHMPERLTVEELCAIYSRRNIMRSDKALELLCAYIDMRDLLPCLTGFMNDMVDYHAASYG